MALVLPLPLAGCLELDQKVTLRADGSGEFVFAMTMRESTIAEVKTAAAAARFGGATDPAAVFDREKTQADLVAAGLELTGYETKRDGGRRTVELAATFADFQTLQKCPLNGTQAEWTLQAGPKAGTAKLTFYPQGRTAWLEARKKAAALAETVDPVIAGFFVKRQQQLEGLDLKLRIDVPGKVYLWTKTLKKTGDRQVTARIAAQDIKTPADLVRRLAPRFEVIFDARGLDLPLAPAGR